MTRGAATRAAAPRIATGVGAPPKTPAAVNVSSRAGSLLGVVARDAPEYTGPAGWAIRIQPLSGPVGAAKAVVP